MANVDSTPEFHSAKENFLYFHQLKVCNRIYGTSFNPTQNLDVNLNTSSSIPDCCFIFPVLSLPFMSLYATALWLSVYTWLKCCLFQFPSGRKQCVLDDVAGRYEAREVLL